MDKLNSIISTSASWIWAEFWALLRILTDGWAGLVILIVILIILTTARKLIKILVWQKVFDAIGAIVGVLLAVVIGLHIYWFISALPNSGGSSTGSGSSGTSGTKSTTPSTQTTPQTQKQLYYTTSCYNCWAEGCNRNGYNYSGYSETNYLYYKSICDQCSCNDKKSQSFWR